MKHLALVPLIGGMAIGAEKALGRPPEAVVSYDGFWGNDKFLMQWYEKRGLDIPYYLVEDAPEFKDIEVVTSLCPCSGLTSANPQHGSPCFAQNRWMLESTRWALEFVRPKVLVGENAMRLYSDFGQPVAATMKLIADHFGYHLALYKTDTRYHGLPQRRGRAFFALYRKDLWPDGTPLIESGPEYHTPWKGNYVEFLETFPPCGEEKEKRWAHNDMLTFVLEKDPDWTKPGSEIKTALETILDNGWADEFIERFPGKSAKNVARCRAKLATGAGIWDNSPKTAAEYHSSVMYRTMSDTVHPRGTSLTNRELMRLMGLPEDMDVPTSYVNAIAQNVPTCTSEWIVRQCTDRTIHSVYQPLTGDGILRQNNCNGKIQYGMPYGKKFAKFGYVHNDIVPEEAREVQRTLAVV